MAAGNTNDYMQQYLKSIAPGNASSETNVGALLDMWRASLGIEEFVDYDNHLAAMLAFAVQPARSTHADRAYYTFKYYSGN